MYEPATAIDAAATFNVHGKRALVTGASRGIGRAIALGLAAAGADLILVARDETALAEVAEEARRIRPDCETHVYHCDIRDTSAIRAVVDDACAQQPVDILINNAGLNIRTQALEVTDEEWQTIVDTDLRGAFFMAQQVGKHMVARRRGSIVNISSVGGHVALRTGVVYAAAKAGVIQMTKVLALEWGPAGIRVNCIAPWYFRTPLTEPLLGNPAYLADVVGRTPLGRVGELHELVGPTLFLASDAASYITGQTLFVDGGMTIYGF